MAGIQPNTLFVMTLTFSLLVILKSQFAILSYNKIASKPINKVPKILKEKLFVNRESNNIKGNCEIIAKQNNLKKYFLKFLVCIYPSEI